MDNPALFTQERQQRPLSWSETRLELHFVAIQDTSDGIQQLYNAGAGQCRNRTDAQRAVRFKLADGKRRGDVDLIGHQHRGQLPCANLAQHVFNDANLFLEKWISQID